MAAAFAAATSANTRRNLTLTRGAPWDSANVRHVSGVDQTKTRVAREFSRVSCKDDGVATVNYGVAGEDVSVAGAAARAARRTTSVANAATGVASRATRENPVAPPLS